MLSPQKLNSQVSEKASHLPRLMLLLILILLFLKALAGIVRLSALVNYPMDITFPEGAVVARAWDVAQGRGPYHDWRKWPHAFSPYGPLTYFPVGWVSRITGTAHPREIFAVGRIQSMLALAGVIITIWFLCATLGLHPSARLLAV